MDNERNEKSEGGIETRRRHSRRKYEKSEKGKITKRKYEKSEKAKEQRREHYRRKKEAKRREEERSNNPETVQEGTSVNKTAIPELLTNTETNSSERIKIPNLLNPDPDPNSVPLKKGRYSRKNKIGPNL